MKRTYSGMWASYQLFTTYYTKNWVSKTTIKVNSFLIFKFTNLMFDIYQIIRNDNYELIREALRPNQKIQDKLVRVEIRFAPKGHPDPKFDIAFDFAFRFGLDNSRQEYRKFIKLVIKNFAKSLDTNKNEVADFASTLDIFVYKLVIKVV